MKFKDLKLKKIPSIQYIHKNILRDEYAWIKQKNWRQIVQNPKKINKNIKNYLQNENKKKDYFLHNENGLKDKIFKELKNRIQNIDSSVPNKDGEFEYYYKYKKNSEYPTYLRKKLGSKEEIILDCNKEAKKFKFFNITALEHSHDHKYIAYNLDTNGSEIYSLNILNLETNKKTERPIPKVTGDIVWDVDNKSFYYISLDINLRPTKVLHHILGNNFTKDKIIYHEKDPSFFCSISISKTKKYLLIRSGDHETSEYHIFNFKKKKLSLFKKRQKKIEYEIDHHENYFVILSNINKNKNFKIFYSNEKNLKKWISFYSKKKDILILDFIILKSWLVRLERFDAKETIVIRNLKNNREYKLKFNEEAYHLTLEDGYEYETDIFRYYFSSPITPKKIFDFNCITKISSLKKIQKIPSGYQQQKYICKRIFAKGKDGALIPITLIHKKKLKKNSKNFLLLYGYGAYGISIPSSFSSNRLSLINRNIIYAIAHVRGGKEKGYDWYENGKLLNKKNTFFDFISCAEKLCKEEYTSPKRIIAQGGSAGGLLMGYIANERPDLFLGIIAQVPFVDICNTMLDDSLPLTKTEFPEWGNIKKNKRFFNYVRSYSPYDNVKQQHYPHMLITGGITDPRVTYWEMTKWFEKINDYKTNKNLLLLHMNMDAGHSGSSGRFDYLKEIAMEYSFVLKICKIKSHLLNF